MVLENITIQDCLDMYNMKGKAVIINDGKVIGFETVEISLIYSRGRNGECDGRK